MNNPELPLVDEEEDAEPLAKRLKPYKAKESLSLPASALSSSTRLNKPHVPTRTMLTNWAKENSLSRFLDEEPKIEADHAPATTLVPYTTQLGTSEPTILDAPSSNITSNEADESLHAILEISEEEDISEANKASLGIVPVVSLPSTSSHVEKAEKQGVMLDFDQTRRLVGERYLNLMVTREMVDDAPSPIKEILALRKAIKGSYAFEPQ
ncbi:hypothetical protein ACFE04_027973 [Oxalis oulophora]